uniref:Putative peroxisomal phytanoyl-coa hydroxylase n=1 Tax=Panstrongylus lignarius TaxID=156445 RepID=A0A224XLE9_9HEMI
MREDLYTKFQTDGFLILENFLSEDEVTNLKKAGIELAENIPPDTQKTIFNTTQTPQSKDTYFLESGDKIRYFFESEAFNDKGELQVPKSESLNKVGHALHWLHPVFKEISFSQKVQDLCQVLRMEAPVVLQSMYIYKNPRIGGEVVPHQDSTYLFTEPNTLIGLWFPLDDATLENGCLWFIPESHTSDVHRRYTRNKDPNAEELLVYDRPPVTYPESGFRSYPVPKGSCVVIHGNVVHKSEANKSLKSRHAYTYHIMDATSKYSPDNWLQSPQGFPLLYPE